ncbi:hypothetical protein [Acinetobacter baumannii]|uniref:hypothetical protein n=1 Tax=Acinetobacter baumannii TaxID=470 RepID=UPI00244BAB77|nr:hypothetical protein [Acinetobacter baumannii]MDH2590316.1 hypothetical protein [Acinetobacter baumannii]
MSQYLYSNSQNKTVEINSKHASGSKATNILCFQAAKEAKNASNNSAAIERLLREAQKLRW